MPGSKWKNESEVNIYPWQDFRVAQVLRCRTRTVPVVASGAPQPAQPFSFRWLCTNVHCPASKKRPYTWEARQGVLDGLVKLSGGGTCPMVVGGDLNFGVVGLRVGLQNAGVPVQETFIAKSRENNFKHGDLAVALGGLVAMQENSDMGASFDDLSDGGVPWQMVPSASAGQLVQQPPPPPTEQLAQQPPPSPAGQLARQFCRTRFQAHLFHISGNIHVLRCMLAHPCTSTQELLELARGWARIVRTPEYQRSVADSTQKTADQDILRAAAHQARRRFSAAMHILQQLRRGRLREEDLDAVQRELVEEEASGELKRRVEEANDLYGFSGVEDRHLATSRLMLRNIVGAS